jgi:hypothetical protein
MPRCWCMQIVTRQRMQLSFVFCTGLQGSHYSLRTAPWYLGSGNVSWVSDFQVLCSWDRGTNVVAWAGVEHPPGHGGATACQPVCAWCIAISAGAWPSGVSKVRLREQGHRARHGIGDRCTRSLFVEGGHSPHFLQRQSARFVRNALCAEFAKRAALVNFAKNALVPPGSRTSPHDVTEDGTVTRQQQPTLCCCNLHTVPHSVGAGQALSAASDDRR